MKINLLSTAGIQTPDHNSWDNQMKLPEEIFLRLRTEINFLRIRIFLGGVGGGLCDAETLCAREWYSIQGLSVGHFVSTSVRFALFRIN